MSAGNSAPTWGNITLFPALLQGLSENRRLLCPSLASAIVSATRPRKQRIMEKAGLRFVAAWLPFAVADALQPEIDAADKIAVAALNNVEQRT